MEVMSRGLSYGYFQIKWRLSPIRDDVDIASLVTSLKSYICSHCIILIITVSSGPAYHLYQYFFQLFPYLQFQPLLSCLLHWHVTIFLFFFLITVLWYSSHYHFTHSFRVYSSVVFHILTGLYISCHNPILKHFYQPPWVPLQNPLAVTPHSHSRSQIQFQGTMHQSTFCLYKFAHSGHST